MHGIATAFARFLGDVMEIYVKVFFFSPEHLNHNLLIFLLLGRSIAQNVHLGELFTEVRLA